ncbi:uncharacterized protein BX664DRAFT_258614 [Halteromyces radiatus]|uniref:uncharacterized protein n=1 Tax=Halteromyces radiatus TaxID=101107 RepID=UPI0022212617|nr:uncharacterized protein BX664DRAFT_258614 [Halteromyces radiatus]KAI8097765.1 hypothetical protein BX664DRAFT_258614 [Halteromyces radiatus]
MQKETHSFFCLPFFLLAWREHQVQIAYDNLKKAQEQEQNASRQAWNDYIETCSRLPVIQKQQKKSNELSAITNVQTIKSTEDDDDFQPIPTVKRRRLQKDTKSSTPDILEKSTNLYQGSIGDNTNNKNDDDDDDNHLLDEKHTTNGISKVSNSITSSSQSSAIQRSLEKIPKIYVCSRTHKQIEQLIGELKELTNYRPRMTVLGSREQLCVHPKVSKSANKNDDCTSLLDTASCVYARQTNQLLGHATVRPSNRALWDIEDIVKLGKSTRGCPYYATRSLFENAEIIFCPYNYVIDPIIRRIMDIKVEGNIIIFDEAHNIEDIARSAGSFETTEADLKRIQKELNQVIRGQQLPNDHNTVLFVVDTLLEWIIEPNNSYSIKEYEKHVHIWSGAQIISKLSELHINPTTFESSIQPAYKNIKAHTERIMNEAEDKSISTTASIGHGGGSSSQGHDKHTRECITTWALRQLDGLFMVFNFLFQDGFDRSFDYSMALIKKIHKASNFVKDASWVYKLGFWCHDPGVVFQELSSVAHSMILTSGTLSPLDTFATELDTKFTSVLEANHVIDSSQVWVGTIPVGPNGTHLKGVYSVVETFNYQDDIGQALQHIVDTVPFGVLCFVPSYSTLDKLIKRWKATGAYSKLEAKKVIYIEPQGDNKQTFQSQLQGFYDTVKQAEQQSSGCTGALFFAVYRGKISEGIDFSNNDCRAVVAIGIPYPNLY